MFHCVIVTDCCKTLRRTVKNGTPSNINEEIMKLSGNYYLISSGGALYRDKLSKLYMTKDVKGNWVVSIFK